MWPLGPSRTDAIAWATAVVLAVAATLLTWAAGARPGAALSLGAGVLVLVIVVAMLMDARGHRQAVIPGPTDD